jgi:translation initiation factor 3 subunit L
MDDSDLQRIVSSFRNAVENGDTEGIHEQFNHLRYKLGDKNAQESFINLPGFDEPEVEGQEKSLFSCVWKELHYHALQVAKKESSLDDVALSFINYQNLFEKFNLEENAMERSSPPFPVSWLWHMVEEFTFQFENFSTMGIEESSREYLSENPVWSVDTVLYYLKLLVQKSKIVEHLENNPDIIYLLSDDVATMKTAFADEGVDDDDEDDGEDGFSRNVDKQTIAQGVFGMIGLLKVYCLMGDFVHGLAAISPINLRSKNLFNCLPPAFSVMYYHAGVCYMGQHRWLDAFRCFQTILTSSTLRQRGLPFAKVEKIYNLLSICMKLTNSYVHLETIQAHLREKFEENIRGMESGDEKVFQAALEMGLPHFVNPYPKQHMWRHPDVYLANPTAHHIAIMMDEFREYIPLFQLRTTLQSFSTVSVKILAEMMSMSETKVLEQLMRMKMKYVQRVNVKAPPLSFEEKDCMEPSFAIENGIVHVASSQAGKHYGEQFIRKTVKLVGITYRIEGDLKLLQKRQKRGTEERARM